MAVITFPLLTVVDDSGVVTSGATVAITSVKDKAGTDVATPGATISQSGANVSVDYDPEAKNEAWIVLAISKAGSTFTGLNAAPAFYLAKDSGRVLTALPTIAPTSPGGLIVSGTAAYQINPTAGVVSASLVATGLDAIAVTPAAGPATTFPQMVVKVYRRFFVKSTLTSTQLKTYADDGTTVHTTQAVSDDLTTQTVGTAT